MRTEANFPVARTSVTEETVEHFVCDSKLHEEARKVLGSIVKSRNLATFRINRRKVLKLDKYVRQNTILGKGDNQAKMSGEKYLREKFRF